MAIFEFRFCSHRTASFSATFNASEKRHRDPHSTQPHISQVEIAMPGPLLWKNLKVLVTRYPIMRGMISYSLIWPTGSLIQQTVEGRRWGTYDWWRVLRFSMYGGLFVAPTLYGWVKISSAMWPQTSLRTGVIKAAVETISYTPGAMTCFYFIMSLLESKTVEEAVAEVGKKFLPTYRVCLYGVRWKAVVRSINVYIQTPELLPKGGTVRMAIGGHHQLHPDPRAQSSALHKRLQPVLDLLPGLHEASGAPRGGWRHLEVV
ncbi:uncharacterized protein LOC108039482 isoform X1 [Drosophila rhopaloa]|uniref:Uncharacterized protein LOC108039482 isoform X1 n=1 Tax=Drosophila rhopaloa TaxID=1041015 RepID=A0A6P4E9X4_DRORH|nr:uncharacterized protein LOC108039482 isoform X1 [Drosophila rhopaloa]